MTNDNDLLLRATDGDYDACVELFDRQSRGQGVRLYPFGRKGPDDEGMAMVAFGVTTATRIPVIHTGTPRASTFGMSSEWIGKTMRHILFLVGTSVHHHMEEAGDEWEIAIGESVTDGFAAKCYVKDDTIVTAMEPAGQVTYYPDICALRELVGAWLHLIHISGWSLESCDLDYGTFDMLHLFADNVGET